MSKISIHWFRRDLRLDDNVALYQALDAGTPVIPLFIFDSEILDHLEKNDARVQFLHETLSGIDQTLREKKESALLVKHGKPLEIWAQLLANYDIEAVYTNRDYEPYARERDAAVEALLAREGVEFKTYKDQVIFEPGDVLKDDGGPYTVYTPYSKKCFAKFDRRMLDQHHSELMTAGWHQWKKLPEMPSLSDIGFEPSDIKVLAYDIEEDTISAYDQTRDRPAMDATSKLSPHLRFGTVSIRKVAQKTIDVNETFIKELFWREFFMQILHYYPHVVGSNFRSKYDGIDWRNKEEEFARWCEGRTGYPFVDAGMRELNETGYMHNRVRMVTASFLTKHLLIDWRWGEAYFAEKLLDFELASNNGNWQWAAGTGCDASPYFRVFNPTSQYEKFDPKMQYIKKWVPEYGTDDYPEPMVEHKMARQRAIDEYKKGIERSGG